tara:strand:+ start:86 stop:532 length:447 start_codon:yes stop_codon:yes gene_type:complete
MTINYAKHDEEFYGVFKLLNGEEILGKAVLTQEGEGETLCFLSDPVVISVIEKQISEGKMMRGMGFHKWMQLSDEEFFIIREKDIIAVASMSKEIVLMYETYLANEMDETHEAKQERLKRKKSSIQNAKGYLGKIDEARAQFEKLFNL